MKGGVVTALAENDDAVRKPVNVLHVVADNKKGHAALLTNPLDEAQNLLALRYAERCLPWARRE